MNAKRLTNLLGLLTRPKPVVGVTPSEVVWTENKWSLLRYTPRAAGLAFQTPLLLVPSLINRHYVLDLMPGKSLAEYLVAQGHDVYCIDWGTPGDEDRFLGFDEIVDRYLGRALSIASKLSGKAKVHVLGYCMGGTLAAVHAAAHPERFASFVALAAPVHFNDGGMLSGWTRSKTFDLDALLSACGNVPWQLLQSAFGMLRPTLPLSKAVMVVDRADNDEFLDGFLALEAWGNDNVAIPGEFYRRYLEDLYRGDCLVKGTLRLSSRPAKLQSIDCPTLVVTFEHDNIVPAASAAPLVELISSRDKQRLHLPGGHVGAVVSKHAAKTLWPQLSAFWAAHEGPVKSVGRRAG
jgi:polyhydroxyalkanoate synthase